MALSELRNGPLSRPRRLRRLCHGFDSAWLRYDSAVVDGFSKNEVIRFLVISCANWLLANVSHRRLHSAE